MMGHVFICPTCGVDSLRYSKDRGFYTEYHDCCADMVEALEERAAIKVDSGMTESQAEREAMKELENESKKM